MPWISANLGDVMGGQLAKAQAAIDDAQKSLFNLNSQVNNLAGLVSTSVGTLTSNQTMLAKMAESGFYMITLSPQQGAWNTRLAAAPNAPLNQGFCTGVAMIILSANLEAAENAYAKTKAALMKPIDDAKSFIDAFDASDFVPELPEFEAGEFIGITAPNWDEVFTMDQWNSATLGDVFGGAMEGISKGSAQINKAVHSLLSQKNQINRMSAALTGGLSRANAFIDDLGSTGTYNILLQPGAGGYLTRLQAESGSPPSDGLMYSAGFVCITTGAGASELNSKFATISTLMGA